MVFRAVRVFEVREVLRFVDGGRSLRQVEQFAEVDRETVALWRRPRRSASIVTAVTASSQTS